MSDALEGARAVSVRQALGLEYLTIGWNVVEGVVAIAAAVLAGSVALGSRALEADAFQTTACFWLSMVTLAGVGLNAALGWWWADPVAALGMTWFIAKEGAEAWRGRECGCSGASLD